MADVDHPATAECRGCHRWHDCGIRNSGCVFPMRRITVNLAPADLKKEGPAYDLPIAVGIGHRRRAHLVRLLRP